MSSSEQITNYIANVLDISQYVNNNDSDILNENLQNLTKALYEYGQYEKSYKKSNKKSRNLNDNLLVTNEFGDDEIWSQIKDHSKTVISTINQRTKYRKNERQKMQQILNELQQEVHHNNDNNDDEQQKNDSDHDHDDGDDGDDGDDDWIDIIKGNGENEENKNDKEEEKEKEKENEEEEDDDLDLDEFQKQTEDLEAFIDKQWNKEKAMAEEGTFDLIKDDMFQRALMYDEENENENDDDDDIKDNNDNEDDFAFLNKHIAKDSDDDYNENNNNNDNNDGNDEWNDLFNLPKFANSNTEKNENKERIENDKKMESEMSIANLSKFELEERAIKERINKLESDNLKQRSWEYQGEISNNKFTHPNTKRDKNSLLSTYIDFDYSDKLKPTITDDLNQSIENLIITKIKNDKFDDVEKKTDFANAPKIAKRKLIEIQDTKSSMGLAELYEREYLQQIEEKQKLNDNEEFMSTKDGELQKQYEKISRLKSTLFYELDQLIRFHYEPKQAVIRDNIKVKTHTNSLYLEETLPFSQSTSMNMTPEQIYRKPRKLGHIKGENEMTKQDRKNKRAANKKRAKYWKQLRSENDKLRANYDAKFSKHLNRIRALNEVRTHALAAAKKNGFMMNRNNNNMEMERDDTRYTSSKQMFAKIQQHQENKLKRKLQTNLSDIASAATPPEKKQKIMSMMH